MEPAGLGLHDEGANEVWEEGRETYVANDGT